MCKPFQDTIRTSSPVASYRALKTEIDLAIQAVLEQPAHILGPTVERFEAQFADFTGTAHAIGVNSGTDAIHLTLRGLGIGAGDEVITVSHTSVATVAAIEMSGATPVLVDIELPWYSIDPDAAEAAIGPRTRAIIAVHLYGQPAGLTRLRSLCDNHGLALIEDCAQSHGATWNGQPTGSIGNAGCYSFYPSKNLGTVGDGGMVVTSDAGLAARIKRLRQYGWEQPQMSLSPGWNSRLGPLQAAILEVKLRHFPAMLRKRRQIASAYLQSFAGLPLVLPAVRPGAEHAFHLFVVRCEDGVTRDRIRQHLAESDIEAGIHYPHPVHAQPAYQFRFTSGIMTKTEAITGKILSIPLYPELRPAEQKHIADSVRTYFEPK